jgi:hypothetical protein
MSDYEQSVNSTPSIEAGNVVYLPQYNGRVSKAAKTLIAMKDKNNNNV